MKALLFSKIITKTKKNTKIIKKILKNLMKKMQKAFKYIDITEAQKTEAKALQQNVFRAFDEIDEMSQSHIFC